MLDLLNYRSIIESLSVKPEDWDGYEETARMLDGWCLMQGIIEAEDAPGKIAYAKFMRDTGWNMRAFDEAPLDEVRILTLALCPDGWWRVWGISENFLPPASREFS